MATKNTKRHKDYIASVVDFHLRLPFLWLLVFFVALLLGLRLRRAVCIRGWLFRLFPWRLCALA